MGFDKAKATRSAEKFLAQGKIRNAITEYKLIVDNDPKDYVTMNLLGDLFVKGSDTTSAVFYYNLVADHYSKQGFSQKAIAIYNKISKIQPNSVGVSERLAELYKTKGSVTEAKSHYVVLAENYQSKGRTVEALAMWKQIAMIDPANTDVYITIANSYLKEGQSLEAVEAFCDAGDRFCTRSMFVDAETAYLSALSHLGTYPRALSGFVDIQFKLSRPNKASEKLQTILEEHPQNRDVLYLLIDCRLAEGNVVDAEKTVVKLVEQEPANYPKLLDLANHYLETKDFEGASRMLTMASEHMLVGGQAEEFANAVRNILEHQPDNLDAVRLLVRFCTWQRDEQSLKDSLARLAEVAKEQDSVEDERFALSQLVMLMPQEASFAQRLQEVNELHGFEETPASHSMFDERFVRSNGNSFEASIAPESDFAIVGAVIETSGGSEFPAAAMPDSVAIPTETVADIQPAQDRVSHEVESIKFYVDSGYTELAEKAIADFELEFGNIPETAQLRDYINGTSTVVAGVDPVVEPLPAASIPVVVPQAIVETAPAPKAFDLGDFRSELGLEEEDQAAEDDSDFDTRYQTAVAYQEMGLLEQAIAEFQEAVGSVDPNDGTKRFFQCANLLGHCFMENGMPKHAITWYERAIAIQSLSGDERQALWYELGIAHEAEGNAGEAGKYFEQVYAEDVDFRDIRARLKNMMVTV
jgi:tetratricopeptide (TPR) repeat protein